MSLLLFVVVVVVDVVIVVVVLVVVAVVVVIVAVGNWVEIVWRLLKWFHRTMVVFDAFVFTGVCCERTNNEKTLFFTISKPTHTYTHIQHYHALVKSFHTMSTRFPIHIHTLPLVFVFAI